MPRPAQTLLERVLNGSFRPVRYASLLSEDLLPKEPPPPFNVRTCAPIWEELRQLQDWWQTGRRLGELDWCHDAAHDFGRLVRYLHGGRRPSFFDDEREEELRAELRR